MADKIKDDVKLLDEDSQVTELKEEDMEQVVGGVRFKLTTPEPNKVIKK